ncbi:hypothetical protein tb265_14890 [Gemmatimonadetes bacterium T265]|nr:hypothetical protein tb265_14890 [Gemmatimonadetes bacterium T265]
MATTSNFVLAFGGTGARCAEALAHLAAARVLAEPTYVLLVDPDENNGNTQRAVDQLVRYHELHAALDADAAGAASPFFSTPLNLRPGDATATEGRDSFLWKYGNATRRWRDLLHYSPSTEGGGGVNALYELLYDEGDLDMTFEQGYVGRAHVGALDMFQTFRRAASTSATAPAAGERVNDALTRFLDALEAAAKGSGARVVVVGSIFGGTGASGLPAVPPFLREHPRFQDLQRNLRVGCVQLAPYFSFNAAEDPNLPDSRLHPITTKSSLFHYGTTPVGYDRVYLVGAPERSPTNDGAPVRGGTAQKNRAHYAELAAALAVVNFFRDPPAERAPEGEAPPVYAAYSEGTTYDAFPDAAPLQLRRNLVSFATACALHAMYLAPNVGALGDSAFMAVMRQETGARIEPGNAAFDAFTRFAARFLDWMTEVDAQADGLLSDSFPRDVRRYLENPDGYYRDRPDGGPLAQVAPGAAARGQPYTELYTKRIGGVRRGQIHQRTPVGFYLELLTRAADDFCATLYPNW